ncbi:MAG: sigma-70 family RNA polymerase sigma factor [Pirellulales bacterium]|nr:sigma-70 family RNA polymerase sigma factor [Pirellulales bacterium]
MNTNCGEPDSPDGNPPPELADDVLLRRFVATRDEQAFGELVRRHSGLVLGVCRRTLRDQHDAEEAFQATFMVLAAKAARVRVAHTVGPWLYGVAYRIAIRAAAKRARRREAALPEDVTMIEDALQNVAECHWRRVLDDELNLLPEKYRSAVVLHYLLGKTNNEVAAELGLSVRTVEGRQRRGKELLKRRLMLRKVSLPSVLGALAATQATTAQAAAPLIDATIQAGMSFLHGNSAACSADAVRLAQNEVLAMTSPVAPMTVTLGTLLLIGAGMGLASGHSPAQGDGSLPLTLAVQAIAEADADAESSLAVESAAFTSETGALPDNVADSSAGGIDLYQRSDAERKIVAALQSRLSGPLDFAQVPLREVVQMLGQEYGVQILFDHAALNALALSPDMEVTLQIRDVPLRSALRHMLNDLGVLDYLVRDDVLLITTKEAAATWLETHIYDVTDAMTAFDLEVEEIIEVIPETVSRETWTVNGTGEGTILALGKQHIAISQMQSAHEEIARFLQQIASHAKRSAQPAAK